MSARHPSAGGQRVFARARLGARARVHVRACVHVSGCVCARVSARVCACLRVHHRVRKLRVLRCVRARMDACGCARTDVPRDDRAFAPSACSSGNTTGRPRHAPPTERMRPGQARVRCCNDQSERDAMRCAAQRATARVAPHGIPHGTFSYAAGFRTEQRALVQPVREIVRLRQRLPRLERLHERVLT